VRISFYAPLKSPDHPVPSGDRRMARLLMTALEMAGHRIALASDFRSYEGTGDPLLQEAMFATGRVEAEHIVQTCLEQPVNNRPEIWFTYHQYYKAPDHLGPIVSSALGIPYVVAEPSHAPKRANGPWKMAHESVTASLEKTDCAFCLTKHDMACVEPVLSSPDRLVYLPPFLNNGPFQHDRSQRIEARQHLTEVYNVTGDLILVAVGMMRPGDKYASYQQLANSLERLDTFANWQLLVVGDGDKAAQVRELFTSRNKLAQRTFFAGEQSAEEIARILSTADICVWPAVGEAYGMALLEAQASGLPVIAGNLRGVPDVVRDGDTALLVPPDDPTAFATAVKRLLEDQDLRRSLGENAASFVAKDRSLERAAHILNEGLTMAVANKAQAR
jgi:glycosyltransferase involved in cell wall biosynthesis